LLPQAVGVVGGLLRKPPLPFSYQEPKEFLIDGPIHVRDRVVIPFYLNM
jgi:hypothetical protein